MSIVKQINNIHKRIIDACEQFDRNYADITLLAVSKGRDVTQIRTAMQAGQTAFGENYVQEAVAKIEKIKELAVIWHFIGQIQTNKTRDIAAHFDWVHTVSSEKIAKRLNDQRPADLPPLNICIQVKLSNEEAKGGITPEEVLALAQTIQELPQLKLRGLMAIPARSEGFVDQRKPYAKLRTIFEKINTEIPIDTLSMGMTNDFVAAIAEGATIVRVGRAIFEKA